MSILGTVFFAGCDFNNTNETIVDNVAENTENGDNISGTESEDAHGEEVGTETVSDTELDASEQAEPAYEGPEISIIMVGDMLMHTPVEESAKQEDGTYSYDAIFANTLQEIQAADLAIVNQEVIIAGENYGVSGYPAFNAPFELGHDLIEAGFDVICHGTNHALDQGKKGLKSCLNFWEENYPEVPVLGIHGSQEDQDEIYVYEQDGVKIAVLNFTYGTNGIALPSDMPYAVDMLEEEKVVAALAKAEELADFTVVCPHWGNEYELGVVNSQEKWTDIFFENGVDLVIGTHPHVIEPIEMIVDETAGRSMLVYYSIGNFVNWTSSSGEGIANRMVGGMAQITIGMDEAGEAFIMDYGVEPVVCHLAEGTNGVTTYFLDDYSAVMASENEIINQDANFSYEYCVELCDKVWGDLWRE
ncbi:MAG: CapA family protein [Roseburia sp.]|nr:CapA family protein [Roseburia sp.]